jgi:hypothetical protein
VEHANSEVVGIHASRSANLYLLPRPDLFKLWGLR